MDFDAAFARVLGHEGAFQVDRLDRGNWTSGQIGVGRLRGTKWGISAAAYPEEDIENLTVERAKAIYLRDYWARAGCDAVPAAIRFDLFDTAVNSGVDRAVKLLQKAVDAHPDGIIGPQTMLAITHMEPARMLARFNGHRLDFLNDNPDQWRQFGRGWAQRIAENLKAA